MPDPYAIDINIFVGGLRVYESKYFSADGNDTLANAVQFVVAERARHMLLEDESKEEDELIESMISTITSIKCVGKPNRELLRFLYNSTCKVCFKAGEDILKYPKKKINQAQKRKEVAANKSAQRNEWNKRRKT